MRRREFITLLGGAAVAWPLAVRAQQPNRVRRIGALMGYAESDSEAQANIAGFRDGLQKLGWTEARSVHIEYRWAAGDAELMQRFAKELVALQPDLILSHTTSTTAALRQETSTIPIIFANVSDPVGSGFVASLARPGGNVTGFATAEGSLGGKWVELLKEVAPRVASVAMLFDPASATYAEYYLTPSKPPPRFSGWRQSQHLFTTRLNSNPSLPHGRASRTAALSLCQNPSRLPIAWRLHRWRLAIVSLPSIQSVSSLNSGAYCPTGLT
jgi:ABC transporter substrate binding protein